MSFPRTHLPAFVIEDEKPSSSSDSEPDARQPDVGTRSSLSRATGVRLAVIIGLACTAWPLSLVVRDAYASLSESSAPCAASRPHNTAETGSLAPNLGRAI